MTEREKRVRWLRALRRQKFRFEQTINRLLIYLMKVPDDKVSLRDMAAILLQSTIMPVLKPVLPPNQEAEENNEVQPKEWFNRLMEEWGKGELLVPDQPPMSAIQLAREFQQVLDEPVVIIPKEDDLSADETGFCQPKTFREKLSTSPLERRLRIERLYAELREEIQDDKET